MPGVRRGMLVCEYCGEKIEHGEFVKYKDYSFCDKDCLDAHINEDVSYKYIYADGSIE